MTLKLDRQQNPTIVSHNFAAGQEQPNSLKFSQNISGESFEGNITHLFNFPRIFLPSSTFQTNSHHFACRKILQRFFHHQDLSSHGGCKFIPTTRAPPHSDTRPGIIDSHESRDKDKSPGSAGVVPVFDVCYECRQHPCGGKWKSPRTITK